ncbi:L,D-transpeptidase [Pseudonocardia dioxanivorans]|uniref:ErfK/YbiS/YcfS/YnhG family protein n=1 Tax=Pseudonocardia dioxanivorans (strain ATCC 55486 / DSM 44775 / JCM 13855 / CB1190) TaxID=675635 RepID=F4CXE8_PSEUX|nr:L,D-transpeptidase [Pseudonocardia dioxanivorans]AEA26522.1 ErfK/YbiS/YcfS/YnhG family protein [Pseudonocardia dioxanivorans CB1190]
MADHHWSSRNSDPSPRRRRAPFVVAASVALLAGLAGVAVAGVPSGRTPYVPPAGGTPAGVVAGTPCTTSARACVDLTTHNAWLIRDGVVTRAVTFVDGDVATPTPTGTFKVEWKAEKYTSREYGSPMPYSVFFAPGGIAFHQGGQKTPSAGCVKLTMADAKAFFADLQVGDEVQVR